MLLRPTRVSGLPVHVHRAGADAPARCQSKIQKLRPLFGNHRRSDEHHDLCAILGLAHMLEQLAEERDVPQKRHFGHVGDLIVADQATNHKCLTTLHSDSVVRKPSGNNRQSDASRRC